MLVPIPIFDRISVSFRVKNIAHIRIGPFFSKKKCYCFQDESISLWELLGAIPILDQISMSFPVKIIHPLLLLESPLVSFEYWTFFSEKKCGFFCFFSVILMTHSNQNEIETKHRNDVVFLFISFFCQFIINKRSHQRIWVHQ